jgi:2,3,4,5-tetrahydropyridine-2-carboxylate N-succinyltransferase
VTTNTRDFKEFSMSLTDLSSLETIIETAFDNRDSVNVSTKGEVRDAVDTSLQLLDSGEARLLKSRRMETGR